MFLTFFGSAVVLNYLETETKTNEKIGYAFHYFKYNNLDTQKPTAILSSLIKQLCRDFKDVPEHLMKFFHEFTRMRRSPFQRDICPNLNCSQKHLVAYSL